MTRDLSFLEREQERLGFKQPEPPPASKRESRAKAKAAAKPRAQRLSRQQQMKALAAEVDRVASPLAVYCLMWLAANPDPKWRSDAAGGRGRW